MASELQTTRWRATITVEFEVRGYPEGTQHTAEYNAHLAKRGAERADRDINCSRSKVRVTSVERA